ncbi:HAMP domain-containing sensor histidine kinase [Marinobacter nanhaiticus D15-8W]|uniref:histidine kinase n=1 Tax=Marinobacter nanhaiticus D15-8W TaxID=626887 RepID=N6W871_9GAMM|nr:HAMP domain-containing sensor histidine kinase [Marinobacter nanhaiticus]ENO16489.1 sensor histidine kinase [Marinobacter nanhaiticus D15-8W]BES72278.1 HAMP domain-containing sensor histidine kinase [Marinobacter nanhaiticus D15-8W]
MKQSLARRLFRYLFGVSLVTALLSIVAIELFYEDMEDTILNLELTEEQAFFLNQIERPVSQSWRTARLRAFYLPEGESEALLPDYLRDKPVPYSAELELPDATYLVLVRDVDEPAGRLYLSQDISIMEDQELLSQLTVLGVLLGMAVVGFVISRLSAKHLVNPLHRLTSQIQATEPAKSMRRLDTRYADTEFADIANAFNRFLDAIEAFVEREKSFVKLASHELRTPLAVMTGALDIIEKRGTLSEADRRTLGRIRRATDGMHSDVDILLKLARGSIDSDEYRKLSLNNSIEDTLEELESSQGDYRERLRFVPKQPDQTVTTDPALLRMLLRNLLLNALKHTRYGVDIETFPGRLRIRDYGDGLPHHITERLTQPVLTSRSSFQESSFGLLIVQLICERQGWQLNVVQSGESGTEIDVDLNPQ